MIKFFSWQLVHLYYVVNLCDASHHIFIHLLHNRLPQLRKLSLHTLQQLIRYGYDLGWQHTAIDSRIVPLLLLQNVVLADDGATTKQVQRNLRNTSSVLVFDYYVEDAGYYDIKVFAFVACLKYALVALAEVKGWTIIKLFKNLVILEFKEFDILFADWNEPITLLIIWVFKCFEDDCFVQIWRLETYLLKLLFVDVPNSAVGVREYLKLWGSIEKSELLSVKITLTETSNFYFTYIIEILLHSTNTRTNNNYELKVFIILLNHLEFR